MHFHGLPELLLGSRARLAVLTALLRSPHTQWTGRELARSCGISPSQVLAALRTFEEEGLAHQRRIGPSSLWSLETGSYLAKTLAPLAKLDEGAQRRLAATMTKALRGSGALEARLFGSVAAGKEQAQSDIDLFVVFPDRRRLERWRPKLERARDQVQEDFGSFLSPTLFVKADLRRATPRRLLGEARRSGIALEVGP